MDTRRDLGSGPAGPNRTVSLQITGRGNVPSSGVSAVAVTITVTGPTAGGFITAYRSGVATPKVSTINFGTGQTKTNAATVQLGADGTIALHNHSGGTTQLIADVRGYYLGGTPTAPGSYVPVAPARVVDTRLELSPLAPNSTMVWTAAGRGGIPASDASAVVLNVTVTTPTAPGLLAIYPYGAAMPGTSTVNFVRGQTVDVAVVVKLGSGGQLALLNHSIGTTQLIIDVSGYYRAGTPTVKGAYRAINPTRIVDTRVGLGTTPVKAHQTSGGISDDIAIYPKDAIGLVLTAAVTGAAAPGYLTVERLGGTSDINFAAGQTVSNLAIARSGIGTALFFYNSSSRTVQVIADLSGYFLGGTINTGDATISAHVASAGDTAFAGVFAYLFQPGDTSSDHLPYRTQITDSNGDVTFDRVQTTVAPGTGQYYVCFSNNPDAVPVIGACWDNQPWSVNGSPPSPGATLLSPTSGTTTTIGPESLPAS